MSIPFHPREAQRLAVLRELGVLDAPAGAGLDALSACAARLTGTPMAAITLIDEDVQWFLSRSGFDLTQIPRGQAFCSHAILGDGLFEVPDLARDPRFRDSTLVTDGPRVRFYAGQPLSIDGLAVGTLCVFDRQPRTLSASDRDALQQLGRAAVELLQSRQRLREASRLRERLFDFARAGGDWMWESDARHRYRWLSDAYQPMTGLDPNQQLGEPITDAQLLDTAGSPRVPAQYYRALLDRQEPFARVITTKRTPRGLLYLSRSAVPVFDAAGHFEGYRGTVRDVTASLASATEARHGEVTLRELAAQVPGMLFTFEEHPDGRAGYPFVSDGAQRVLGMPAAALQADALMFFRQVHPPDLAALGKALAEGAARLTRLEHSFRMALPDGSLRWFEMRAAPTRLSDGGTLWHGFTADVTGRKAIEEALRAHEDRWQIAANAARIGIAEFTLADGLLSLDRRACINHGFEYPHGRLTLDDWVAQIDPADRDAVVAGIGQALAGEVPFEGRYRIRRPDGSMRWLEFVVRATRDQAGAAIGAIGTCRDVHEQQLADEMSRGMQEAERSSRAKNEFLSRVSHELRTPLNGILGFTQLMALDEEHPLAAPQAQRLASVQRAGRRLLDLINDVLELSRIESADLPVRALAVDLDAALHASLSLVQPLARGRTIAIEPPPPSGLWVRGDERAIEQVLMNLLSNAIKYSTESSPVLVSLRREGGQVSVAVRDRGVGLSAEQQARLFQPFDRLGAERHRIEGSGLGLVIARQLAEAMGGSIGVVSAPGAGSTFTLRLCEAEAPSGDAYLATQPGALLHEPPLPRRALRQVVYIEDELLNQVLLQEVFRARPNWQLHIADDGATGLRLARKIAPHLMLIDMNLPDTNGLALVQTLRADPSTRQLRCIALSADAMNEQIVAARRAGFDDYWTKPIDVARVLAGLDALLDAPD
ncbi:ATP-binding protein [Methylibium sp.]|uniref:ATP-binding protein n=1 Tax=Methylibium sp. TaxID=2067992 RepID=UPI003D0FAAB4